MGVSMELAGSTYLYTLAQLSMAFVAFSTIVVVFRLGMGATLSKAHLLVIRLYIELGLMATGFSMLPMLLAVIGWPHATVWRISSVIGVMVGSWWLLVFPRRHHASTSRPMPKFVYVQYLISWIVILYLFTNVVGYPFEPFIGPNALATTWMLVSATLTYSLTMVGFLQSNVTKDLQEQTKQTEAHTP